MGCTARDKHNRANRKARPVKPDICSCCLDRLSLSKSILESSLMPLKYHLGLHDSTQNPKPKSNPNLNPTPNIEETDWEYCSEEQLEEILLKNLEFLYHEAVSKLVALGYDEEVAFKAVLRNGHCSGGMDVLTNILHNSMAYLNGNGGGGGGGRTNKGNLDESEPVFSDLRQLEEYSLAGMVSLLQKFRPHLTKDDAMWCLLMSDFHVGKANTMEIPMFPAAGDGSPASNTVETVSNSVGAVTPALCRGLANGGGSNFPTNGLFSIGEDVTLQRDIEFPKRFNLSPSMKSLLKRNVAAFAAGMRANSKELQTQVKACPVEQSGDSPAIVGTEIPVEQSGDSQNLNNQDVNSMLSKFRDLNLDENLESVAEDQKDEVILTLLKQIKDLEKQVKERKDWAHVKAMQAAKKLSSDLTEMKLLRMEREETHRLKKGKQTLEDTTLKRLSEMETALRKASGQVDRANAAVRKLEAENAEIKAEMEASKLSASESVSTCLQVAKREKKCLKRLLAWEKQKAKLQLEISDEKSKILEIQEMLGGIERCQKEAETKWREDLKAKEEALTLVEEERRSKEEAEANNKRKLEALRLKIEIDFQRHKDDLLRLEQELSHLKASTQSAELHQQSNALRTGACEGTKAQREKKFAKLFQLQELEKVVNVPEKEDNSERICIICKKDEVSIVLLPCAHQVMCASCSGEYRRNGKTACPCCRVSIQQMIRVFGATS